MKKNRAQSALTIMTFGMLTLLALSLSPAQLIAEEQDIIGVYFDEAATINTITVDEFHTHAWVAIRNMSSADDLAGIAFRVEVNGECASSVVSLIGSQNYGSGCDMILGADIPIPSNNVILVGVVSFMLPSFDERRDFYIRPIDWPSYPIDTPAYITTDDVPHDLTPSSGSFYIPVATINPDALDSAVLDTWGGVKSLYR